MFFSETFYNIRKVNRKADCLWLNSFSNDVKNNWELIDHEMLEIHNEHVVHCKYQPFYL